MMENMLFVMLSVMALGALAWYARQRALRRTGFIWLGGAVLGFLLGGPLGVVVWVGIAILGKVPTRFESRGEARKISDDGFVDPDTANETPNSGPAHSPGLHFNYRCEEFDDGLDPAGIYDPYHEMH